MGFKHSLTLDPGNKPYSSAMSSLQPAETPEIKISPQSSLSDNDDDNGAVFEFDSSLPNFQFNSHTSIDERMNTDDDQNNNEHEKQIRNNSEHENQIIEDMSITSIATPEKYNTNNKRNTDDFEFSKVNSGNSNSNSTRKEGLMIIGSNHNVSLT
eukprot:Awhi_evm1s12914